jgi:hypothetical protein
MRLPGFLEYEEDPVVRIRFPGKWYVSTEAPERSTTK